VNNSTSNTLNFYTYPNEFYGGSSGLSGRVIPNFSSDNATIGNNLNNLCVGYGFTADQFPQREETPESKLDAAFKTKGIAVYPNPCDDELAVNIDYELRGHVQEVVAISTTGIEHRLLWNKQEGKTSLKGLAAGFYQVRVTIDVEPFSVVAKVLKK
jgi:hypothetical protein